MRGVDLPYDLKHLDAGCIIEQQHTADRIRACRTARQRLREDPKYYTRLCATSPGESGCELIRSPWQPWPWVAMVVGLGIASYAAWRAGRKG